MDSIATMANTAKYHPNAGPPAPGSTSPDREARAIYLLTHGPAGGLDYRYFIQEIMQDFSRTQQEEDLMPVGQYLTNPVLSRYKTVSGCVIRGCKPGDNPLIESIMWLTFGELSLSVAMPLPVIVDEVYSFLRPSSSGQGMAGSSDRMKMLVYDYTNGRYEDRYADTYMLVDIRTTTFPLEDSLFNSYDAHIAYWRTLPIAQAEIEMGDWAGAIQLWAKSQYDSLHNALITAIPQPNANAISSFALFPNYPNPFNSMTIIEFSIELASSVKLQIFNLSGQEVWRWESENVTAGRHRLRFHGGENIYQPLPGGVYFYRLRAGKHQQTRKMIYVP
jgi:hypothetical protein